jgi:hypothetical protein
VILDGVLDRLSFDRDCDQERSDYQIMRKHDERTGGCRFGLHVITAGFLASSAACSIEGAPCGISYERDGSCYAGQLFASRDTAGIVPTQLEVERYAERWSRAVQAEPLLTSRHPQTYRDVPPSLIDVLTSNSAAIMAWQQQTVATGDPVLDTIIEELQPTAVERFHSNPGGPGGVWLFALDVPVTYSEEHLATALLATGTAMSELNVARRDDARWTWSGATAQIEFDVGFGDCFVACSRFRHLRAVVPPAGRATVYDLGGDPLPEGVMLSPETVPL